MKCVKVEPGLEPEAFTKAWGGRLRITTTTFESQSLFICLGQSESGYYLQQECSCFVEMSGFINLFAVLKLGSTEREP